MTSPFRPQTVTRLLHETVPDVSWWHTVDARRELAAGLTGALLVIPQAVTFAYLAGVPPEYGLYCAIFVGFLASLFGNSPMVGGPNTAVAILLGLTVLPFSGRGSPLYTELVLVLSLLVGLIQLAIWALRGAALFRFFSPAAIAGIKVGVGVLLITSALESAFGLSALSTQFFYEKFYIAVTSMRELVNPYAAAISGLTMASGLLLKNRWPSTYVIAAVLIGSLAGGLVYGWLGPVQSQLELLGHIRLQALPLNVPHLGPQHWLFLEQVIPSAIAIAVLGLAQSLVIARDIKTNVVRDVDLHKEVFAQGIANTLSPFFSTFAGSGSFNRTNVAIEMGARTPLSGLIAAIGVVALAWAVGPLLSLLPMPVIGGVLALVGIGMIQGNVASALPNRIEGAVYLLTLFSVIFLGLEVGIFVAILASIGFFVASASELKLTIRREGGEERIIVAGNLYYASIDHLARHLHGAPRIYSILDISRVPYCDATARNMIENIQKDRARHGGRLDVISASTSA